MSLCPRPVLRLSLAASLAALLWADAATAEPPDPPAFTWVWISPNHAYRVNLLGDPASPHYFPLMKGLDAMLALDRGGSAGFGNPRGYHHGYTRLGFLSPFFSESTRTVQFYDCKTGVPAGTSGCDSGLARMERILMPAPTYRNLSESCIRAVLGHELFHKIQHRSAFIGGASSCSGFWGKTVCEGQARALQDKIYLDLDLDPAASCMAPYLGQVNAFLADPNMALWSASYNAALFWTYLMEQYGGNLAEPERGADFLVRWWQRGDAAGNNPSGYAVTEATIKDFAPSHSLVAAFHNFTVANALKHEDLSLFPTAFRQRYTYRDEDPLPFLDNQMSYDPVAMTAAPPLPASGSVALPYLANAFGTRYFAFDTSACGAGSTVRYANTPIPLPIAGLPALPPSGIFSLAALRGSDPVQSLLLWKNRSGGWVQEFVQPANPYPRVVAAVSGRNWPLYGIAQLTCLPWTPGLAQPTPAPKPSFGLAAGGGEGTELGHLLLQIEPPPGILRESLVSLDSTQVQAWLGQEPVAVLGLLREFDRYRLPLALPRRELPGSADLRLTLGERELALPAAVSWRSERDETLLAIDRAPDPPRGAATKIALLLPAVQAAREAARRALDAAPDGAPMGLLGFCNGGAAASAELLVPLAPLDDAQRALLRDALDGLSECALPGTRYDAALNLAREEFDRRGQPGVERRLVLMGNSQQPGGQEIDDETLLAWAAGTMRIHALALGARADAHLLSSLARLSGGEYLFDPLRDDDPEPQALSQSLAQLLIEPDAAPLILGRLPNPTVLGGPAVELRFPLPERLALAERVQPWSLLAAAGVPGRTGEPASIRAFAPDGGELLDGVDGVRVRRGADYAVFALPDTLPGEYRIAFEFAPGAEPGPVAASGHGSGWAYHILPFMEQTAALPERDGLGLAVPEPGELMRVGAQVLEGLRLAPATGVRLQAQVLLGDPDPATPLRSLTLHPNDAGERGDTLAEDGRHTALWRALPTGAPDRPALGSANAGNYRLSMAAASDADAAFVRRIGLRARGSGAPADPRLPPLRYVLAFDCLAATAFDPDRDSDGDGLSDGEEWQRGTDPCDADSSGGGELDGSMMAGGRDPLDPQADRLAPIRYALVEAQGSEHEDDPPGPPNSLRLRFDSDPRAAAWRLLRSRDEFDGYLPVARLDPALHPGRYLDTGLVSGARYCYRLQAEAEDGSLGAPSAAFCGVAHANPEPPQGGFFLSEARPRSSATRLRLNLEIDNRPPAQTQVRVMTRADPQGSLRPFAPTLEMDVGAQPRPASFTVWVSFVDDEGQESEIYVDDIVLMPPGSLGSLRGRAWLRDAPGQALLPATGAHAFLVGAATEPPAFVDADGDFRFEELLPDDYPLGLEREGYLPVFLGAKAVGPDAETEAGDIVLHSATTWLFLSGFE